MICKLTFFSSGQVNVMIMSLKAASIGLNLVAASLVLITEPWWNPTTEDQFIDQVHRIGQTRHVRVVRLMVNDSVKDRMVDLHLNDLISTNAFWFTIEIYYS